MRFAGSRVSKPAAIAAAIAMVATLLGCGILGGGREPPAGAQVVRVIQTGDQVSLEPSTARAGEIWLEFPPEGATLVTHGLEGLEPLSDEEIARLEVIKQMKPLGFSLQEMKDLLDARDVLESGQASEHESEQALERLSEFSDAARRKCSELDDQLKTAAQFIVRLRRESRRHRHSEPRTGR